MSVEMTHRKQYPIYILLDVSASMRRPAGGTTPQAAFTRLIPELIMTLADAPALASTAWLSVIAFSDGPELLSPMTALAHPAHVREPAPGRETDYAAALGFLSQQVGRDATAINEHGATGLYRTVVAHPLVFVITDGAPYSNGQYQPPRMWLRYRDRLVGAPTNARIAAIGLAGAHPRVLRALATGNDRGERNAFIADPGADPAALAASVINVIERSIKVSVRIGDLIIDAPRGMRRISCPA
ncbi:vWA domain-containing protein [Dactylosporangium sp. CA-092794]|uniref:vWA domain-containing protein n=1 Tax=Dactylosporangium sp. CA-092794 TaxID=3239929 RepID=UPI003D9248E9